MIIPLVWLYEAFFLFDLSLGLAWTTSAFQFPGLEEPLLHYLGWIGALAPFVHAIALGRAAIVRRFIVVLPIFALLGDLVFRFLLSPSLLREIQRASEAIKPDVAEFAVSHHPTALFYGLSFSLLGLFVGYPLYRRLLPLFEGEGASGEAQS